MSAISVLLFYALTREGSAGDPSRRPRPGRICYDGHQGDHMRITTVREFRDKATVLLRSTEPVLITRRGRMAGVFFPSPEGTLPVDLKRELFDKLSSAIARQVKKRGGSEP